MSIHWQGCCKETKKDSNVQNLLHARGTESVLVLDPTQNPQIYYAELHEY